MLEKLALKHSLWLKMAKGICKDAYLADDLVSEMYLKMNEADDTKTYKDGYIKKVMYNLFMDYLKAEKKYVSLDTSELGLSTPLEKKVILDGLREADEQYQKELKLPDCITWVEKQILLLRQNNSGREIGKQYHIHWRKIHRIENEAKKKLKEWVSQEKLKEQAI